MQQVQVNFELYKASSDWLEKEVQKVNQDIEC